MLALGGAGQPDVRPQGVDEHAHLGIELLGQDALEDEAEARPHLRRARWGSRGVAARQCCRSPGRGWRGVLPPPRESSRKEACRSHLTPCRLRSGPGRERAVEVGAEHRALGNAQEAEDDLLAVVERPGRLLAELADARPASLGGVELLQDGLALGTLPVGSLDLLLEVLDGLGQLGVLALPDRHRLLAVLVGGALVVVLLAPGYGACCSSRLLLR